ncbi:hypothetical protein MCOR03_001321 [Pyricularia oryzae]|nr:hypothetical protein MCOR05_004894 [Pyricularia oryzae]KAI6566812.1 hypothetical protein MCOR03_001321 [Pyricularia oryzae]
MPAPEITEPNPPPLPSNIPDSASELAVRKHLPVSKLSEDDLAGVKEFRRAACYIAAAMIFLRDNVLLADDLTVDHIKPRLLGHWGTCPGLVLVWAHLNLLVRDHDLHMIHVIGPGHGAPAALAALWLEGSLERFYPGEYDRSSEGLKKLITRFSVPGGFPSHINAETPGAIHEGGELGYALSVSFGAVMDKPDLVVACVIGDGEAESGPTATAWHSIKYLDPAESGAVLPILHVNGFKISERTIFGCMDDKELVTLFTGYGYQVRIVEELDDIDNDLHQALEWGLSEIRNIQKAARSGEKKPIVKPRWPMIIMRTPKGWSGPKEVDGKVVEGSFRSHQVPLPKAGNDETQLELLRDWLASYKIGDLLEDDGKPIRRITDTMPRKDEQKLGQVKETYAPEPGLEAVDWKPYGVEKKTTASCMATTGSFLDAVFQANPNRIRLFSPDELESNKLHAILDHTQRNFQWDAYSRGNGGRVIETLSEHQCQGFMQGYTLTGRTAIFPSYESFLGIVHTMMVQYSKFVKIAKEVKWRGDLSSINYIETSTWARQEHNGFSHQNPSFIGAVLNIKPDSARVYLPPDANCFLSTAHHCVKSKNYVNLMIGSKQPTRVYLSPDEAAEHCKAGAGIFHFASTPADNGGDKTKSTADPDVVLVGIGVEVTAEAVAAAELLLDLCPELKVRMINVTDLMILIPESRHPHSLSDDKFEELFTADKPVLFNYHGYATELQGLLFGRPRTERMTVEGYREEGSTTTPFDMMLANCVSRFHLARRAIRAASSSSAVDKNKLDQVLKEIQAREERVRKYIDENGKDPEEM